MQIGKEELGGIRKLFQDLLAPELGSIKATLVAIQDGQQQMREDMQRMETRLIGKIESVRSDLVDRIELTRRELLVTIENRSLREELEHLRQLAKSSQPSA